MLLSVPSITVANSFLDRLSGSKQPSFLPPDQVFKVNVETCNKNVILVNFSITPGYYLYRNKLTFSLDGQTPLDSAQLPIGENKNDPNFGAIEVYHHSFQAKIDLKQTLKTLPQEVTIGYQGCSDQGLCYPPIEKKLPLNQVVTVCAAPQADTTIGSENENSHIANILKQGNFALVVTFFFGAGLLLAFTPCVFPMIPILSGIIVGHGNKITHRHAFFLSLTYVMGMALTYAAAGIAAGLSGELISSALQTPWVLGTFAVIFVILSLSMFGFYEMQLPSALQSRLTESSNKLHGGHFSGVFAMGALSAIIMSPCVAAPMAGALLYIGQTHDAALGGTALFALALGMGAPLLLIGTSAGTLLPKAGVWMEAVKKFFGLIMLALAIWIVSPVISIAMQMILISILLIILALLLGVFRKEATKTTIREKFLKFFAYLTLIFAAVYLIGGISGATDVLRPLAHLTHSTQAQTTTLRFERIKSLAALNERLAQVHGKKVMLDFYADWCVSCKEMERITFSDPEIHAALKGVLLFQVDVTANNEDDKLLLKNFQLFGPPATLFFNERGQELADFRVMGYQNSEQFLQSLSSAGF
jgi:thiol:disulfide interchange protein DsbD